ncbi:hypothetical protein NE237_015838 [Protea cynaroides]|uniref:Uncharacterized protein n=1 Tax=Protea cynaroides TaxID=273540 RepID=A0A9Q0KES3_9MAGN|nr:hypothetical protein NE237_015838 [Protea cynaroides]
MSVKSSFIPSSNQNDYLLQNASTKIIHKSIDFHPSIWGDHFITNAPSDKMYDGCIEQAEKLKEEVRRKLVGDANGSLKKLSLIDSVQRFGVAYHFEEEIEKALEMIHDASYGFDDNNLYTVALRFRLLRQQGYNVPCGNSFFPLAWLEVINFNRFKGSDGIFKKDLINDVSGMLCLYEATHLRVHGEDILDEALEFTTIGLKSIVTDLKPSLATQVMHALEQPLYKNMPRELSELSIWWKKLDFATTELSFFRDRLVECHFWTVGMYYEPCYTLARKFYTKLVALSSIIDDTYDVYGTVEELQLFTDAIESALDGLPEYMKLLYSAILDVYIEAEEELRKEGQSYRVNYAKEAVEQERGHVFSAVECYMKQYDVSEQEVHDEFNRRLAYAWKDINEACLKPTAVPRPILLRFLNLARIVYVTYKYKDGYTLAHEVLKDRITLMFVDPIPM